MAHARRRQRLFRAVVALVMGLLITNLLAIAFVWRHWYYTLPNPAFYESDEFCSDGEIQRHDSVGISSIEIYYTGSYNSIEWRVIPDARLLRDSPLMPGWLQPFERFQFDECRVVSHQTGWPMPTFRTLYQEVENATPQHPTRIVHRSAVDVPGGFRWKGRAFRVPIPHEYDVLGTILNTVVYALGVFALLSYLSWARQNLRMHRGRCPRCAYDLAGDLTPGCPECGWNRALTPA